MGYQLTRYCVVYTGHQVLEGCETFKTMIGQACGLNMEHTEFLQGNLLGDNHLEDGEEMQE